jgi:general secretion pathway protein A
VYKEYFGLTELPFELTANTRYLFLTDAQREALSVLQYGLFAAKAITLLTGEAGTGKTTLLKAALLSERCRAVRGIYVDNPLLTSDDFVRMLALKFELGTDAVVSKSVLLSRLEQALRERRAKGEITALVVDEAQALNTGALEELRLLANFETPTQKLLPLVLAGQPELGERLEQPELRQLKQRVSLRCEVEAFELNQTAGYIAGRLTAAGGVPSRLFTQEAIRLIHANSGGIARSINVICDNALVAAMAARHTRVDSAIVLEVCRDLKLAAPLAPTAPRPGTTLDAAGDVAINDRPQSPIERPAPTTPVPVGVQSSWARAAVQRLQDMVTK